ncbi:copper amine oxidase N-terminal domain-containing protein [Neomoorella humiferrea]|uniref:copper amine oxidase N-terminal domain-containing protein n=1 Tax=Neomoorella humiferrea TaxID=676965 RepID=UPI003D8FAB97
MFSGNAALDISSDFTGDVKVKVEAVGLNGGAVVFTESEDITIARVAGDKNVNVTADTPKLVSVGSDREGAKITISEGVYGALTAGGAVYMQVVTPGVKFDLDSSAASRATSATGIRFVNPSTIAFTNATVQDEVYFNVPPRTITGLAGSIEVTPILVVDPSAAGDIKIKVYGKKADGSSMFSSVTVTVAKVTSEIAYEVTDIKNTGGKVYAGHGVTTLKENDKEAEFTIKSVAGNFPSDAIIKLELQGGAKFDSTSAFSTNKNVTINLYNDDKSAWFKVPNDDDIKLYRFNVKAAGDVAAGDIVVKLSSTLGNFNTQEVVIGKVVSPISVSASGAPEVAYLGKSQAAGDITITEAKDGAIKANGIKLVLPDGVTFAAKPTVTVTDGNIDVSASLENNNKELEIKLDKASGTASTIKVSNIKYNVNRLALDGDIEVKIEEMVVTTPSSSTWADTEAKTLAKVVNATVISESTIKETVFKIGDSSYTVNGVAKTLDAAPYIKDGRTFLPVRYVAEAIGVAAENIVWDAANSTAVLIKGDRVVSFKIGQAYISVNGVAIPIDAAPEISNGRTMAPLRAIAQAFGAAVDWDEATQTVTIH